MTQRREMDLVMLGYCDLCAIVRGRWLPATALDDHSQATVGWVPSAVARPPFGRSVRPNPFGATGDLRLRPDLSTRIRIPDDGKSTAMDLVLCDLIDPGGEPWECCPREFLRRALRALNDQLGIHVTASFEHEFQLQLTRPAPPAMSLEAHRAIEPFASRAMQALHNAGLGPEQFIPESGTHQYEIPVAPLEGVASADRAVMVREVIREMARREGVRPTFSPMVEPDGQGNGMHIHLSLRSREGEPLLYDPDRPGFLSDLASSFAAGILSHALALTALTAPSPVSHLRLQPGRRAAGTVSLGDRNRETMLRIPPIVAGAGDAASQLRLEYRAADVAANPYLALGSIIYAGLAGVREHALPPVLLSRDPDHLSDTEKREHGVGALPASLQESLAALITDDTLQDALGPRLYETYSAIKHAEIDACADQDVPEVCARYAGIY